MGSTITRKHNLACPACEMVPRSWACRYGEGGLKRSEQFRSAGSRLPEALQVPGSPGDSSAT